MCTLAIVYDCFRILGSINPATVSQFIQEKSDRKHADDVDVHPIAMIRHFISSRELNDIYFFLSCLSCLDPSLWAGEQAGNNRPPLVEPVEESDNGTGVEHLKINPVLDQWEVERIISSLESDDEGIRELVSIH